MTTQYRLSPLGAQIMFKQTNEIWRAFWRTAKHWALMTDPDSFEDIHSRSGGSQPPVASKLE
jgi:hypothetical protein